MTNHPSLPTRPGPDDHTIMAAFYRLIAAYDSTPRHYARVVAETMASPHAAGILSALVGYVYATTLTAFGGDRMAATAHLCYELDLHRDLDNLTTADLDDTHHDRP